MNKLDNIVEKINNKIGWVLGRKPKKHESINNTSTPNKTSNIKFAVLLISTALLLWASTGFYYLSEDQTGVVFNDGKISNVINGVQVGVIRPYPFANIEILDSGVTDFISIEKNDTGDGYATLTKDLLPVALKGKFNYKIVDPKRLLLNFLFKDDNLHSTVKFEIWHQLHTYIAAKTLLNLRNENLTVMAEEIKQNTNIKLANLGIEVVRLQIDGLNSDQNTYNNESSVITSNESTAVAPIKANIITSRESTVNQNQPFERIVDRQRNLRGGD